MTKLGRLAGAIRFGVRILLPLILIVSGGAGFYYLKSKEVKMKRKPVKPHEVVVETLSVSPGTFQTRIHAMGTVLPEKEVVLKAQVQGRVVAVSPKFVQGGLIQKGETLVRLEESDYRLALDKAESLLDKALADLEIEKGQQLIAREELKLISSLSPEKVPSTALALRKPQLAQARASVAVARSEVKTARLNLERTRIIVPFDALVLEKHVDLGSTAASQASLATLAGISQYRVEAQVPLDRLDRIWVHETRGSSARIRSLYAEGQWEGRVVRTTGKITGQGRMAGVVIEVPDPLNLKGEGPTNGLLLDDHVAAVITGRSLDGVYVLPRALIRENNTLWVYESGRLSIRKADPVWKEKDRVFLRSGLNPGDRVIISDIPVPVQGMPLDLALDTDFGEGS